MDANRLSQGQMVASVSAIALFIVSFLPWFGFSVPLAGSHNVDMWERENPLDVYLLLVILLALAPTVMAFAGGGGDFPLLPTATTILAAVGTLMLVYQIFDPGTGLSIKIGFILGLAATVGITIGSYLTMQEDFAGERY